MSESEDLARLLNRTINDEFSPGDDVDGEVLADAILAAGWSRLVLDDATVERAARALAGTLSIFKWEHIGHLTQEMYRDKARAVLAAAVESPRA